MKLVVVAVLLAISGCGMVGTGVAPAFPDDSTSTSQSDDTPRFVTPATGGLPVLATPIGGTMYQPVMGGLPIVGF